MKEGLHPEYYDLKIVCSCGHIIETAATLKEMHVEICSKCHPFYTGKQKLIDTEGRVDRFKKKYAKQAELQAKKKSPRTITIND